MNLQLLVSMVMPLFDDRVFPDSAPFDTPKPYCTWQQVGGKPMNLWAGGATDKVPSRIQFNVWAETRLEASTKIQALENLLKSDPLFGRSEGGAIGRYESDTLYGAEQHFSFWLDV